MRLGDDATNDGGAPIVDARPREDSTPPEFDAASPPVTDAAPATVTPPPLDAEPLAPPLAGIEDDTRVLLLMHRMSGGPPADSTNRYAEVDAAARLGQKVFFDESLSPRGLDCAFCHVPANAFTSALTYDGFGGLDFRNVPALVGSAWQSWYFWDGRADSMWAQFIVPFEKNDELGGDRVSLARRVTEDPTYRAEYGAVFGQIPDLSDPGRFPERGKPSAQADEAPLDAAWRAMRPEDQTTVNGVVANVGKAVAAYQRRLRTGTSAFDAFLDALATGDAERAAQYPEAARRGAALFVGKARCSMCHAGPVLSDGGFHNLGLDELDPRIPLDLGRQSGAARVLEDPFNAFGPFSDDRVGPGAQRARALGVDASQAGQFRTPTLRNVAGSRPWFHDGRFTTLDQVVAFKNDPSATVPQVGERDPLLVPLGLSADEQRDLVAFLETLTDAPQDPALSSPP